MAQQPPSFQTPTPQYRSKLFSDEVREADPDFNKPQAVYEFRGRTFREVKPYEPSK
jgi:hypothetical protein